MKPSVDLKVDWCSYEAAKYAVEHWHYSKTMPAGKTVKIGVWEKEQFIGVVIFSLGCNRHIHIPFGLKSTEVCELTRIALTEHASTVSKIIRFSLKLLKKQSPNIRLVVSFAAPYHNHHGGIYQAANWIYVGRGTTSKHCNPYIKKNGQIIHFRTVSGICAKLGVPRTIENLKKLGYRMINTAPKHKYVYPLDKAMRRQVEPLRKPYPKRMRAADSSDLST